MTKSADTGLARDAALNLAARLFAMACSSVTALVIAAALTKHDYGAYSIIIGINVVLVMALDLGLTSSLARYVAQGRATTALVIRVALVRLAIIGAAAFVVLGTTWLPAVDRAAIGPLMPWLAALIVTQSLISFQFGSLPALRRIKLLLLITVLQPASELTLVLIVRARDGGAAEMLMATVISGLAVSLLAWLILLAPGRAASPSVPDAAPGESATVRLVAQYGRTIFLVSLLIAVIGQIDQFVIGIFHPIAQVAPYALAIKLQALVAAPGITIAGIVAPRIAGAGAHALAMYRRWLAFLVTFNLGAVLVLAVLSAEAFGAIGAKYRDESMLLVAMAPFLLLSAVAPLPSITLNQTGHAGARRRVALITLAINAIGDLLLVPPLGAWGAVIATTAAFAFYLQRHHVLVTQALTADATIDDAARSGELLARTLVRGTVTAIGVAVLAGICAFAIRALADDPSDLVVLVGAGGIAAVVHATISSRIVRGGAPDHSNTVT